MISDFDISIEKTKNENTIPKHVHNVVSCSSDDIDKITNILSNDAFPLLNGSKPENGINLLFNDKQLPLFENGSISCKVSPMDLKSSVNGEVNSYNILVPNCNSFTLENKTVECKMDSLNGLENSISDDTGKASTILSSNIEKMENSLHLANQEDSGNMENDSHFMNEGDPDNLSLLEKSKIKTDEISKLHDDKIIKSEDLVHSPDSAISVPPEENKVKSIFSQDYLDKIKTNGANEQINSEVLSNSSHSKYSSNLSNSNNKEKHVNYNENQRTDGNIKNTCDDASSFEFVKESKIDENSLIRPKDENVPLPVLEDSSNSSTSSPIEAKIFNDSKSSTLSPLDMQNVSNSSCQLNSQTKTNDISFCTSLPSNSTSSHSSQSENFKTITEKNLNICESSNKNVNKENNNLKRKTDDDDDNDVEKCYRKEVNKRFKSESVEENMNSNVSLQKQNSDLDEKGVQNRLSCLKSCNGSLIKKESGMNPNELYQGLLNDVLAEDKELIKEPEIVRTKLQRIKRKDLEDMIIDQLMNKILYDHEIGYQRELCKRLEQTLEAANKRALRLTQEIEALRNTTNKVASEHRRRKNRLAYPTKVKRSVGIQANKSYISQGYSSAFLPDSDVRFVTPTKYQKSRKSGSDGFKRKTKIKSEPSSEDASNKSEEDYSGIGKTIEQKLSTLRNDLKNFGSKDKKAKLKRLPTAVNGKQMENCELSLTEHNQESPSSSEPTHPAPLPHIPFDEEDILSWKVPPSPSLKVHLRNKSIILSWNISSAYDESLILSYQLFSYEENKEDLPSTDLWQKIGSVKALELPMACTLTQFKCGRLYHFAVRAMTKKGRLGPFSSPKSLRMPPK